MSAPELGHILLWYISPYYRLLNILLHSSVNTYILHVLQKIVIPTMYTPSMSLPQGLVFHFATDLVQILRGILLLFWDSRINLFKEGRTHVSDRVFELPTTPKRLFLPYHAGVFTENPWKKKPGGLHSIRRPPHNNKYYQRASWSD